MFKTRAMGCMLRGVPRIGTLCWAGYGCAAYLLLYRPPGHANASFCMLNVSSFKLGKA